PFIEQTNIYTAYKTPITGVNQTDGFNNQTSTDPTIVNARTSRVSTYLCPARRGQSLSPITTGSTVMGDASAYAACSGDSSTVPTSGVFGLVNSNHVLPGVKFGDITDGLSNTFMIGEKHTQLTLLNDPIPDGLIYSASEQQTYRRRAGPSN